jgi:catalase
MKNKNTGENKKKKDYLTTNQGVKINHTDDSQKAGSRGPAIMDDFHLREKITHFDHERIPERVVHARGSAAHGYFQVYEPQNDITMAKFLQDPSVKTPVFVRFSTVVGFRGSADTVRDVRGFATKFYTEDGVFDLVGNNIPVFFIQDGIKFPDLVHAIKPEPHNEMPQASAAHDNFWDFISLMPESMHMIMWVLSDRALPRSYDMMEGFGVHTFRLINEKGRSSFVKFHWKPLNGMLSLVWDEVQKIAGKDPDFNRKQLWENIEKGNYPEYELGIQVVNEEDEHNFNFDLLDPTKIIPEELVPVRKIGKMVLDRNPDNFFAETEQVAFHPGNLVSGIDFTNDPLLQARLFSYLDTQINRFGSANFSEVPINRPHNEVSNNQRDGFMRQTVNKGRTNYFPNSLGGGCPMTASREAGGYIHYPEKIEGVKTRERNEKFKDFFTQAKFFYNSQSPAEKEHLKDAFLFELGKVETMSVRERMIEMISNIDSDLAATVADGIGVDRSFVKNGNSKEPNITFNERSLDSSPVLSIENHKPENIKGRKIAVLIENGFDSEELKKVKDYLKEQEAEAEIISSKLGKIPAGKGENIESMKTYLTTASVLYDAVYIPGGMEGINKMKSQNETVQFIKEAYMHYKPVAGSEDSSELLKAAGIDIGSDSIKDLGIIISGNDKDKFFSEFKTALLHHRFWIREVK